MKRKKLKKKLKALVRNDVITDNKRREVLRAEAMGAKVKINSYISQGVVQLGISVEKFYSV